MRATSLLWVAAGRPSPRKPVSGVAGVCAWCGVHSARSCRHRDVYSASFTDHDEMLAPQSAIVCEACAWAFTGRPPDTLRLWSLVYRTDRRVVPSHEKAPDLGSHIHAQNKADPSEFDRILRDPPGSEWVCSVADSGQIHVVPFARVNSGRTWCIRFERFDVTSTSDEYTEISDVAGRLYRAGFSKADLLSGDPHPGRLVKIGISAWVDSAPVLDHVRGSPLMDLVVFLLRKPKTEELRNSGRCTTTPKQLTLC